MFQSLLVQVEEALSAQMSLLADKTSPDAALVAACARVSDLSWQVRSRPIGLCYRLGGENLSVISEIISRQLITPVMITSLMGASGCTIVGLL